MHQASLHTPNNIMTDYTIRRTTDDDYEAIADFLNSTNPPVPANAETMRNSDAQRRGRYKSGRWVAEQEGRLLALGFYEQVAHMYDPTGVHASITVAPEYRQVGIGSALYGEMEAAISGEGIRTIHGWAREDEPASGAFVEKLGFVEEQRLYESGLDVTTFDADAFLPVLEALPAQGIMIRSYAEVKGDPALERTIYDLNNTLLSTIPSPIAYTLPKFEEFRKQYFDSPKVPAEAIVLAFAGDDLVGLTMQRAYNDTQMNVDMSGVLPAYRGKGVALALKVAGIVAARDLGITNLRTTNDSTNPAIISINRKLGFVPRPAMIMVKKEL